MTAPGLGAVPPEQLLAARRSALFLLTLTDYGVIDPVMRSNLDALLDDVTAELQDRAGRTYLELCLRGEPDHDSCNLLTIAGAVITNCPSGC